MEGSTATTTPERGRWHRRLPRIALALAVAGLAALSAIAGTRAGIEGLWRGALARAACIDRRLAAAPATRPCLWGEAMAGDAWADYGRALQTLERLRLGDRDRALLLNATSAGERRERDLILNRAGGALAALVEGARREAACWVEAEAAELLPPAAAGGPAQMLGHLACARADVLAERQQGLAAVHLLLDALQFARDLAVVPRWRAEALGAQVVAGIFDHLAGGDAYRVQRLPADALAAFDAGLARLDASIPEHGDALLGDSASLLVRFAAGADVDLDALAFGAWRYGFSPRAMAARHFEHIEQHARDCAHVFRTPRADRLADLQRLRGSFERSANPLTRRAALAGHGDPRVRLHLLTRVRLLRLAVRHRLGDPLPHLPDPRGGLLAARADNGRFRAASTHAGSPSLAMAAAH